MKGAPGGKKERRKAKFNLGKDDSFHQRSHDVTWAGEQARIHGQRVFTLIFSYQKKKSPTIKKKKSGGTKLHSTMPGNGVHSSPIKNNIYIYIYDEDSSTDYWFSPYCIYIDSPLFQMIKTPQAISASY